MKMQKRWKGDEREREREMQASENYKTMQRPMIQIFECNFWQKPGLDGNGCKWSGTLANLYVQNNKIRLLAQPGTNGNQINLTILPFPPVAQYLLIEKPQHVISRDGASRESRLNGNTL